MKDAAAAPGIAIGDLELFALTRCGPQGRLLRTWRTFDRDLLASILVSGHARYSGPWPSPWVGTMVDDWIHEGLLVIDPHDRSADVRKGVSAALKYMRRALLELNRLGHTSANIPYRLNNPEMISFDEPLYSADIMERAGQDEARLVDIGERLQSSHDYLRDTIGSLLASLETAFGGHLYTTSDFLGFYLHLLFNPRVRPRSRSRAVAQVMDQLLEASSPMGRAGEIDTGLLFAFNHRNLANLWAFDRDILGALAAVGPGRGHMRRSPHNRGSRILDQYAFWRTLFLKLNQMHFAKERGCALSLPRNVVVNTVTRPEDADVVLFHVFLSERGERVSLDRLGDVCRLRDQPTFRSLQDAMKDWQASLLSGSLEPLTLVRRRIAEATKVAKAARTRATMGRWASIAAIPAAAIDYTTPMPVGTGLGIVGVSLSEWAARTLRGTSWLQFGQAEDVH